MEIRSPTNAFISVDFPTLGFPMIFTNPALCIKCVKGTDFFSNFVSVMEDLHKYLQEQLKVYPLAAANYEKLRSVRTKEFKFDRFTIFVHFNPARAVSSLAKLDAKSIAERPCFLCEKNRPAEQGSIDFKGKYDICVNPFPICTEHYTVISKIHEPQKLSNAKIDDFFDLAEACKGWVALYNGAKSGASAPDHFHFQLGCTEYFTYPVETPMPGLINKISFFCKTKDEAAAKLKNTLNALSDGKWNPDATTLEEACEPQINMFCEYTNGGFMTTLFPRKCHRPRQFFAEDETKILISPGAIDMTGHLIVAREEDFEKITKDILIDVYNQVTNGI